MVCWMDCRFGLDGSKLMQNKLGKHCADFPDFSDSDKSCRTSFTRSAALPHVRDTGVLEEFSKLNPQNVFGKGVKSS